MIKINFLPYWVREEKTNKINRTKNVIIFSLIIINLVGFICIKNSKSEIIEIEKKITCETYNNKKIREDQKVHNYENVVDVLNNINLELLPISDARIDNISLKRGELNINIFSNKDINLILCKIENIKNYKIRNMYLNKVNFGDNNTKIEVELKQIND